MSRQVQTLLAELLKPVSRSFYLTLRALPSRIRPQVGLAYLLARTTDSVADTQMVPAEGRMRALHGMRERILGAGTGSLNLGDFALAQDSPAEWKLLERADELIDSLETLSSEDQQMIRIVLATIISGQELDLKRFGAASRDAIVGLETDAELDDYTYRVAGCVGEFWTRICRRHEFPEAAVQDEFLLASGIRFGKGLQLVNILRDLPADLRQGRCYLPADRLWTVGLTPGELLNPDNEPKLRPLYDAYLDQARDHLAAGWQYTDALPRSGVRLRLACAWPILIGVRTLEKLRSGNVLAPELRIRVSRAEVRRILLRTVIWHPWPQRWSSLFPVPGTDEDGNKIASRHGSG